MNITLFKKHDDLFAPDILHSYWVTPIDDASGLYSNWKDFSNYSEEELENLKFDVNPTTISIPNKEIVNGTGMFRNNQLVRSVDMDFPNMTDITWMFAYSHLEDITADFSAVTSNNGGIFAQCPKLKTVRCNFQNLENRVMDDTQGINDYSFTFSSCPKLETVECNFSSLKNGDNLFLNCSNLKNFDCELDSLETAVNFCRNAKLTVVSVKNIAEKIKPHDDNEVHLITMGIPVTKEGVYSDSPVDTIFEGTDYWEHFTTLREKGWTVEPIAHGLSDYTYTLNDADIVTNVSVIEAATGETYIKENQKNHGIFAFALSKSHFIGTDENRDIKRIIIANDGSGSGWTAPGEGGYMALRFIKNNNIVGEDCYWSNNTQQWNGARKNYMFNFENIQLPADYDVIRITLVKSSRKNSVTFDTNFIPDDESRYKFRTNVISTTPNTELQHSDDSVCYCDLYWPQKQNYVVETIVQLS